MKVERMMNQHKKAYLYIIVAAIFLAINGYIKDPTIVSPRIEPIVSAITWIVTVSTFIIGFLNYIANFGHDWAKDNIVKPVSSSVNFMTYACSSRDIAEIKTRLEDLEELRKKDKDFWDKYF